MALGLKPAIMLVIGIVTAIVLVPTLWESVWTGDVASCQGWNTTWCKANQKDCRGTACTNSTSAFCTKCINGTSWTLLKLVPMLFIGAVIIGSVLLGYRG